ncbi:MAG: PAS domain-containing protein [Treponema sp.]|jgi:two-component system phosphate regulon sensor histidine kinase PhoR|nr:PAS domain-containing protein [Treponema sp.]
MKTIFGKSLLVLTAAALGLFCFFVITVLVFMNTLYYETNTRNIRDAALLLANQNIPWQNMPRHNLPPANSAYRVTIVNKDGTVVFDSHFAADSMENHGSRPEFVSALAGKEGGALRKSDTAGMDNLYFALPLYGGGFFGDENAHPPVSGALRLALPVANFRSRIAAAVIPNLYLPLLIIAAAVGAVYLFSSSLGRSFMRLEKLAKTVSSAPHTEIAALPPVISVSDTEEFRTLETALREMAAELARRIEKARAEGSRLEGILNGMNEAVFAMDDNLLLRLVNPCARKLFDIPDGGGKRFLEAVHATELEAAARRVLACGLPEETELSLLAGGGRHFFRVFAGPLKPAGGVIIVLEDITRLKRLEQIRKDFVANVSHELRTPIQLIKGYAETLLYLPPSDAETLRRGITIIQKNAAAMECITTDLLSLAAIEDSGGGRPETVEQKIKPLLDEAADAATFRAREKNTVISVDCPPELSAKVHGTLMVQAVINLLDNAVKYTPHNSKISVRSFESGGEIVIEVEDSGAGIPPEHLERIFERFYRIDRAHARAAAGAGLGLAIVRHIALIHGGTAEAESRAGEGSIFRIKFPAGV